MSTPLHSGTIESAASRGPHAGAAAVAEHDERFALGVVAVFLLVTIPVMAHHEMWRDEIQAWLLARDTRSLGDLFRALRYEGHPVLWYYLLRVLESIGHDMRWMQWLSVAIGALTVYIFVRAAPFSRALRALFAFGYFTVYGYTIVARSYGLEMLLWIALCAAIASRRSPWIIGLLLILVANTVVYGGILVLALVGAFLADAIVKGRTSQADGRRLRSVFVLAACGALGVALLVVQVRRPPDTQFNGNGIATPMLEGAHVPPGRPLLERLTPVWQGYVPVSDPRDPSGLWLGNFLTDRSQRAEVLAVVLSAVMVVIAAILVRRSVLALSFFLFGTLGLFLFSVLIFTGSLYHDGQFFLVWISALWLAASERPTPRIVAAHGASGSGITTLVDRHAELLVTLLFGIQAVGGIERLAADYVLPFSDGEFVADYLRAHGLGASMIATNPGMNGTTVAAYLDRPVYELDRRTFTTYTPLEAPRSMLDDAQTLAELERCCLTRPDGAVLIMNRALRASAPGLGIEQLVRPPVSLVPSEAFHVYRVRALRGDGRSARK